MKHGAYLRSTRKPLPEEHRASVGLARMLRKIKYPVLRTNTVLAQRPPGRLHLGEARRLTQQVQMQQTLTARPFRQEQRAITTAPPLRVGIMCDISGSMRNAMEPLAVTRWVLADALHAVQGEVATVLFGEDAHGIQRGRQRQHEVDVYEATGGWENYIPAFSMVDGELNLIDGDGARMLVIITDGQFNDSDAVAYAETTMDMCAKAGVVVLWVTISGRFARADTYGYGSLIDGYGKTAVEVAQLVGNEVVKEFQRVTAQR